jgi:lipoyl synthase
MSDLNGRLRKARELSWERFGKRITFYLPGMFTYNGLTGKYPAASITGTDCTLQCDHCRATILESMIRTKTPEALLEKCKRLADKGHQGVLLSGGCDGEGRLLWADFIPAIKEIKKQTNLYVSIHSGLLDADTALNLKEAGVDQALIDVIGDEETYRRIYHVRFGIERIESSLASLQRAGLPAVPHIVCGLHYGKLRGEKRAVEMISRFKVQQVVIVSLMTIPGTPLWGIETPGPEEIAEIIVDARLAMPDVLMSLGCARKRGAVDLELLAIDGGVNRMALPSEEAVGRAMDYGLEIRYQRTCCSVSKDLSNDRW